MSIAAHTAPAEQTSPHLVLLPGTLCDARIFEPLLDRLPSVASTVILIPNAGTIEKAAEHVLSQAPESFALLGFSLGGIVALEIVLTAPHRICGLALISTTPSAVSKELHAGRRAAAIDASSVPMSIFVEQQLWPGYAHEDTDRRWLTLLASMAESLGPAAFGQQTELALSREDFRPRLRTIHCPTLILSGDRDRLCPAAAQKDLAEGIPHAQRVTFPDAGHLALLEKPDETAQAVAAWLETAGQQSVCQSKFLLAGTSNKEHG